jgi:hypothetical protein
VSVECTNCEGRGFNIVRTFIGYTRALCDSCYGRGVISHILLLSQGSCPFLRMVSKHGKVLVCVINDNDCITPLTFKNCAVYQNRIKKQL